MEKIEISKKATELNEKKPKRKYKKRKGKRKIKSFTTSFSVAPIKLAIREKKKEITKLEKILTNLKAATKLIK